MTTNSVALCTSANEPLATAAATISQATASGDLLDRLERMSIRGLRRMFSEPDHMYTFRVRRTAAGVVQEGLSLRYTAITVLGLAQMKPDIAVDATAGTLEDVRDRMLRNAAASTNLGDVALSLWAGDEAGASAVSLEAVMQRLADLYDQGPHPVVELAWAVSALSMARTVQNSSLRDSSARDLLGAFNSVSKLFPHIVGQTAGVRTHVSCFADIIYPIQALAKYSVATGNQRALDTASSCAAHLCSLQGEQGQWWWHYDYRSGNVLERYPVYAIHQDAMGPMGLRALYEAGGLDCRQATRRGMEWLVSAPELNGGSLIDPAADLIWRKVARREPGKLVRYLQSAASLVHPAWRVPAVDIVFPPRAVDYEDRAYHLGWLLYAWAGAGLPGSRS